MHWFRRHRRGRPPHPDVLTPAEWRVLELVREDRPNAEIAVRLGITVPTVKTHITRILAKTGARNRDELARWDGRPSEASRAALGHGFAPPLLGWLSASGAGAGAKLAAGVAASAVFIGALFAAYVFFFDEPANESAELLLEEAGSVIASPADAGIDRLAVSMRWTTYFLRGERQGQTSTEISANIWYEAPRLQRVEGDSIEYALDGTVRSESSSVHVWDGTEYWRHDEDQAQVSVMTQDPDADPYLAPSGPFLFLGELRRDLLSRFANDRYCRRVNLSGEAEVVGRTAHVVELAPARCGLVYPGHEGEVVLWIDQETGVLLRSEGYAGDGTRSWLFEVETIEVNGTIDPERFRFAPPSDVEVRDRREQSTFEIFPQEQPESITLAEAQAEASFDVRAPAYVPDGFALAEVHHHWPGGTPDGDTRPEAGHVRLRYENGEGGWILLTQGFGGILSAVVTAAPEDAARGTVDLFGKPVPWVEGWPVRWEPGTLITISWFGQRAGSAWSVEPLEPDASHGRFSIGLSSNVLDLDELVAVAESLD